MVKHDMVQQDIASCAIVKQDKISHGKTCYDCDKFAITWVYFDRAK